MRSIRQTDRVNRWTNIKGLQNIAVLFSLPVLSFLSPGTETLALDEVRLRERGRGAQKRAAGCPRVAEGGMAEGQEHCRGHRGMPWWLRMWGREGMMSCRGVGGRESSSAEVVRGGGESGWELATLSK